MDETIFGVQTTDVTWGRYPNGTGSFIFMNPTYSAMNSNWPISIQEIIAKENGFNIYPNPAGEMVTIKFNVEEKQALSIYSILGNLVYQTELNNSSIQINISDWSKGIYFVKTKNKVKKFIVK